jgi:hypothetical protein
MENITKSHNTVTRTNINFQLAESILDKLGFVLRDLSLIYGDVVIPSGDISHELYYSSHYNNHNLLGFIWIENEIYYTKPDSNHRSPEIAALDLLDPGLVQTTAAKILLERQAFPDYP